MIFIQVKLAMVKIRVISKGAVPIENVNGTSGLPLSTPAA